MKNQWTRLAYVLVAAALAGIAPGSADGQEGSVPSEGRIRLRVWVLDPEGDRLMRHVVGGSEDWIEDGSLRFRVEALEGDSAVVHWQGSWSTGTCRATLAAAAPPRDRLKVELEIRSRVPDPGAENSIEWRLPSPGGDFAIRVTDPEGTGVPFLVAVLCGEAGSSEHGALLADRFIVADSACDRDGRAWFRGIPKTEYNLGLPGAYTVPARPEQDALCPRWGTTRGPRLPDPVEPADPLRRFPAVAFPFEWRDFPANQYGGGETRTYLLRALELPYPALAPPDLGDEDEWRVEVERIAEWFTFRVAGGEMPTAWVDVDPAGTVYEPVEGPAQGQARRVIARPLARIFASRGPDPTRTFLCIPGRSELVARFHVGDFAVPVHHSIPSGQAGIVQFPSITQESLGTVHLSYGVSANHPNPELALAEGRAIRLEGELVASPGSTPWSYVSNPILIDSQGVVEGEFKIPAGRYRIVRLKEEDRALFERCGLQSDILEGEFFAPPEIAVQAGRSQQIRLNLEWRDNR